MSDDAVQKLTDAILEKDKGTVLPIDLSICYEYGMKGLCGKDCPDYGSKEECLET